MSKKYMQIINSREYFDLLKMVEEKIKNTENEYHKEYLNNLANKCYNNASCMFDKEQLDEKNRSILLKS